jgi:hypothetical protein
MKEPSAAPAGSNRPHPGWLLLVLVAAGHLAVINFPRILPLLGLDASGRWFIDSAAILAAADAVRAGADPWKPNPLDFYGRPHCYSAWWLGLAATGITRDHNFLVGSLWAGAFLGSALFLLRPATAGGAALAAAALLSPPVLLAVNRANNDLVVFALLAIGLAPLTRDTVTRNALFTAAVTVATGLKFYPLAATAALLLRGPRARAWALAVATAVVAGVALATSGIERALGTMPAPGGLHAFGMTVVLDLLELSGPGARAAGGVILLGLAAAAAHRGLAPRCPSAGITAGPAQFAYVAGVALLTACFLATGNYAYRLIFSLLLLPHLASPASGKGGRATLILLITLLWLDGLYCLALNATLGPRPPAEVAAGERLWLLATQPVAWITMALLAASVLPLLRPTDETRRGRTDEVRA